MDQLNPYQAPETQFPTVTEVHLPESIQHESHHDLIRGLKLLKSAAIVYLIVAVLACFWDWCNAYGYFVDDPLQARSDYLSYILRFWGNVTGEVLYIAGLYFCSTRVTFGMSRIPLLIALIAGAIVFPDQIYQYALEQPWIYFEGYGNTHAIIGLSYLGFFSWFALEFWLILWTSSTHDTQNQRRVFQMIFCDLLNLITVILTHMVTMLLLTIEPDDHRNLALYFMLCGTGGVAMTFSNIIALRLFKSLVIQISENTRRTELLHANSN